VLLNTGGYDNDLDIISDDPVSRIGLSWVKAQLLRRASMQYTEVAWTWSRRRLSTLFTPRAEIS